LEFVMYRNVSQSKMPTLRVLLRLDFISTRFQKNLEPIKM
jgi:hypothetical protein